jgi:hypothetical protein
MSEDEARKIAANEEPEDEVEAHKRKAADEPAQEGDDGDDVEGHARPT